MRKNRKILFLALFVPLIAVILISSYSRPAPSKRTAEASSKCDRSLASHVYHPQRLHPLKDCITVTGTIMSIRREPDGDDHIRLQLDPQFAGLLNAKNISIQHGDLVIEPICLHVVTQSDAIDACIGSKDTFIVPAKGTHVTVTGPYVFDVQHGWNEIHPVETLTPAG
jgi:hypothetical protein